VGPRESRYEIAQRIFDRIEENLRESDRERGAQCVPEPRGIFRRDPSLVARDP
jgi:hypothetical protein